MIDSLFTPHECVLHITQVGTMVREARHLFLHKGCWPKFKGYAYAQLHKMRGKKPIGKRLEIREELGTMSNSLTMSSGYLVNANRS